MLMKKFVAATSREAMQKMKNELGPDALVISNRKVAAGVEILAMAENAVESLEQHAQSAGAAPAPQARSVAGQVAAPARPFAATMQQGAPRPAGRPAPAPAPRTVQRPAARQPARGAAPAAPVYKSLMDFATHLDRADADLYDHDTGQDFEQNDQDAGQYSMPAHAANPFAGMAPSRGTGFQPAGQPAVQAVFQPPPRPAAAQPRAAAPAASAPPRPQAAPPAAKPVPQRAAAPAAAAPVAAPAGMSEERLLSEFKAMKAMLQSQLQGVAFRDMSQRRPLAMKFWRELADAGFSATVTRTVVDKLPDDLNEGQARKWLGEVLSHNLHCADAGRDLVEAGGTYALVGPTGVGKTTTIAKLAARCVVKYGAGSLGLITTDSYRIGAFDQLAIYGKILGVKVHSAQSFSELEATLGTLQGKRLVLIDTTGMGQRDSRLAEQINLLDMPQIRRLLLLNAAAQAETLDDVARAYQGKAAGARPLTGVIFSKIDEAAKLGPVLDTAMRHVLDVFYVATGQRVPEDLHPAKAQALVHRALKLAADPVFALRDDEVQLRAMSTHA